jgi:serine/threonine-protein kinase RsbW
VGGAGSIDAIAGRHVQRSAARVDGMSGDSQAHAGAVVFDGWDPPAVGGVFEVTVPAMAAFLDVVRTTTAELAARLSLSLDDIEDLRSAVNEACAIVLALPAPDSASLTCRYEVLPHALAVRVSAPVNETANLPARRSFAWQALTTHATEVDGAVNDGRAWIELRKPRR